MLVYSFPSMFVLSESKTIHLPLEDQSGFRSLKKSSVNEKEITQAYKTLGINRKTDLKGIKSAYRKSAMKAHPDLGGSNEVMGEVNKAYENDRYMYNRKTGRLADSSLIHPDRPVWFVSKYEDKEQLPLHHIDLLTSIEVNESDLPFDVMWDGEIVHTMNEPKLILTDPLCAVYTNKMVWNNPRKVSVTCEVVVVMNQVDRTRLSYHNSVKPSFCLTDGIRYHYDPSNKCVVDS